MSEALGSISAPKNKRQKKKKEEYRIIQFIQGPKVAQKRTRNKKGLRNSWLARF
jgi:hypothetical protein